MPFINLKTTVKVSAEQLKALTEDFSKHIELLPGKSDHWLMQCIEDGARITFRSVSDKPAAMIDVSILGASDRENYEALTAALTDSVSAHLGVPKDRIYVKFSETDTWGYAGELF